MLIEKKYLYNQPIPQQDSASFQWDIETQIWRLFLSDEAALLSPLGNNFSEISTSIIDLMVTKFEESGSYGRTWGDYRYTDLGLNPEDWQSPIEHMVYKPSGANLLISPEEGYKLEKENEKGDIKTGWYGNNLIYNVDSEEWYYHSVSEDNIVVINTLTIVN